MIKQGYTLDHSPESRQQWFLGDHSLPGSRMFPVLSEKQFGQTAQDEGSAQNCQAKNSPAISSEGHDPGPRQQRNIRQRQEKGPGEIAVHAVAPGSVPHPRDAHDRERNRPDRRSYNAVEM